MASWWLASSEEWGVSTSSALEMVLIGYVLVTEPLIRKKVRVEFGWVSTGKHPIT